MILGGQPSPTATVVSVSMLERMSADHNAPIDLPPPSGGWASVAINGSRFCAWVPAARGVTA